MFSVVQMPVQTQVPANTLVTGRSTRPHLAAAATSVLEGSETTRARRFVDSAAACNLRSRRTKTTRKRKTSWACCSSTRATTILYRRRDWASARARVERSLWTASSNCRRALLLPLVRGCGGRAGARNLQTKLRSGTTTIAMTKETMTMVRVRTQYLCRFLQMPFAKTHFGIVVIRRAPRRANVLPPLPKHYTPTRDALYADQGVDGQAMPQPILRSLHRETVRVPLHICTIHISDSWSVGAPS
ncbi:hypothetical protein EDB89DRAFT_107745 [Lactarius sanguifluus]|nr:hypothetical protein EDB89DRAFT_107745 [Lactarius sanguifluus]